MNRKRERQDNNRRAAWNRVDARFNLSKDSLDQAKKSGLNPYRVLRDQSLTRTLVEQYIQTGRLGEQPDYGWGDLAIEDEIARVHAEENGPDYGNCPF